MLHKTRGIVFRTIPYSDSSLIVHIYTQVFGLRSYLVNGSHGKKAKIKANVFQPLSLVEMNVTNREKNSMHRISDITLIQAWTTIPYDILKSSLVMFLNEILSKSIREEEPNELLFEFISHAIQILDLSAESPANFHLVFLAQLADRLGFAPHGMWTDDTPYFNLAEGVFQGHEPSHPHFMSSPVSKMFAEVLQVNFENSHSLTMTGHMRKELLRKTILYFQLHISTVKEIKSHVVLEEVFG